MSTTYDKLLVLSACTKACWDVIAEYADNAQVKTKITNIETMLGMAHNVQNLSTVLSASLKYISSEQPSTDPNPNPNPNPNPDPTPNPNPDPTPTPTPTPTGMPENYYAFKITKDTYWDDIVFPNVVTTSSSDKHKAYLTEIHFSDKLKSIGKFEDQSELTSVVLPGLQGTSKISFSGCTKLQSIAFPNITAFNPDTGVNRFSIPSLTSLSLPRLEIIGGMLCRGCSKLKTVNFTNATKIMSSAFENCTSLSSLSFPSAGNIDANAFKGCSSLTALNIPKTSITNFTGIDNLKRLSADGGKVTNLDINRFKKLEYLKLGYRSDEGGTLNINIEDSTAEKFTIDLTSISDEPFKYWKPYGSPPTIKPSVKNSSKERINIEILIARNATIPAKITSVLTEQKLWKDYKIKIVRV